MYTLLEVITEMDDEYQGLVFDAIASNVGPKQAVKKAMEVMHEKHPDQYKVLQEKFKSTPWDVRGL